MSQQIGPQTLDESRVYKITLAGSPANPSLVGHYDGTESFGAKLWQGAGYPSLVTLTAAWDKTITGNPATLASPIVLLTISKAMIASVVPGSYQIEVVANPGTLDELVWQGSIRIDPGIGTTAIPRSYTDYQAIVDECSWIGRIENLDAGRAAGFLPEQGQASRAIDRMCMARWRRANDDQASRHKPVLYVSPFIPVAGFDGGPTYGDSTIPDMTMQAASATFAALLTTNGLVTTYADDFDGLRRLTALYALYLILDDLHGNGPDDTPYQVLAQRYRERAMRAAYGVTFRVLDSVNAVTYELVP